MCSIRYMKDERGIVDTSRDGIADTFAMFYEAVYDSEVAKRERGRQTRAQNKTVTRYHHSVRKKSTQLLKNFSKKKSQTSKE